MDASRALKPTASEAQIASDLLSEPMDVDSLPPNGPETTLLQPTLSLSDAPQVTAEATEKQIVSLDTAITPSETRDSYDCQPTGNSSDTMAINALVRDESSNDTSTLDSAKTGMTIQSRRNLALYAYMTIIDLAEADALRLAAVSALHVTAEQTEQLSSQSVEAVEASGASGSQQESAKIGAAAFTRSGLRVRLQNGS